MLDLIVVPVIAFGVLWILIDFLARTLENAQADAEKAAYIRRLRAAHARKVQRAKRPIVKVKYERDPPKPKKKRKKKKKLKPAKSVKSHSEDTPLDPAPAKINIVNPEYSFTLENGTVFEFREMKSKKISLFMNDAIFLGEVVSVDTERPNTLVVNGLAISEIFADMEKLTSSISPLLVCARVTCYFIKEEDVKKINLCKAEKKVEKRQPEQKIEKKQKCERKKRFEKRGHKKNKLQRKLRKNVDSKGGAKKKNHIAIKAPAKPRREAPPGFREMKSNVWASVKRIPEKDKWVSVGESIIDVSFLDESDCFESPEPKESWFSPDSVSPIETIDTTRTTSISPSVDLKLTMPISDAALLSSFEMRPTEQVPSFDASLMPIPTVPYVPNLVLPTIPTSTSAYAFVCSKETELGCIESCILAASHSRWGEIQSITPETDIYLFNKETSILWGRWRLMRFWYDKANPLLGCFPVKAQVLLVSNMCQQYPPRTHIAGFFTVQGY